MIFSSAEITSINALKKQSFSAAGKKWGRDLTYFAKWQQKECGEKFSCCSTPHKISKTMISEYIPKSGWSKPSHSGISARTLDR
jgi:hypothetical protein